MEERYYRLLLAILTGLAVVNLITIGFELREDVDSDNTSVRVIARFIGYGLLPVAAAGLWFWQPWAFWVLGLATITTLFADLPDGIQPAFWRLLPHLTMIALTVEQYYARKEPEEGDANSQPKK